MLKGVFYILVALLIDGFQVLVEVIFTVIGATAAPLAGAALGSQCPEVVRSTCVVAGSLIGSFATLFSAGITLPAGAMIGLTLGVVASLTLGTAFVFALAMAGMFYPTYVLPAYLGEVIPGLDLAPSWTVLAWKSVFRKKREDAAAAKASQKEASDTAAGQRVAVQQASATNATAAAQARQQTRQEAQPSDEGGEGAAERPRPARNVTSMNTYRNKRGGPGPAVGREVGPANDDEHLLAA